MKMHQRLPTVWSEREELREKGQFWTPDWVAKAMLAYVAEETDLIFDPATGNGAFFDALLKLDKPHISYYGTDVDATLLNEEIYQHPSCNVELRDFIKTPPSGKFKAIIANPPYIRHHRIDEETKTFLKKLCQRITGFTIDGRAGYHIYFLLQALNLLAENGKLAFIMPADTCEGVFAKQLWQWVTKNYCLECVVTFDRKATPFPNVDTNAIVFLIKKAEPNDSIIWVKANQAYSPDLRNFVVSKLRLQKFETIEITVRKLDEAINTGLSRPQQEQNGFDRRLSDFATVMRGIATGSNEFFFLTKQQVEEFDIPVEFLKRAVGRTRDIVGSVITTEDLEQLEKNNRPTYLLSLSERDDVPRSIANYLKVGEEKGLPNRSLIKQRKPWYRMEKRIVPEFLFAYLGRRNTRFIKNDARVLPLTSFLCVYPNNTSKEYVDNLWHVLNHPETLENLSLIGKSYGSGAIKVEPGSLGNLIIPQRLAETYEISSEKSLFRNQECLFDNLNSSI